MNKNFWKDKKVLITGYEGFLGSHLTKTLSKSQAKIIGLDIKTFRKETILAPEDYKKINVYKGSVTNRNILKEILKRHSIDVIFHLAAESIVENCYQNPVRAFTSNIRGTWELLEAARLNRNIQAIIVASSDKVYGEHKNLPYKESTPLLANHPYDVSKASADLIATTYAHTYNLPVAVTRCGNIYGPGDFNFNRLIPGAIKCALTGKTFLVRSNGRFVRDYVFVEDVVNGYILLAEKLQKLNLIGEVFNFSAEKPLSVLDVLIVINKVLKGQLVYKILNKARYEIENQYLDSKKSKEILNWEIKNSFYKGITLTIHWFKQMLMGNK